MGGVGVVVVGGWGVPDNAGLTRGFWPPRPNGAVSVQPPGTKRQDNS